MSPGRRRGGPSVRRYARTDRVNEILREVLAEELARLVDVDERLEGLTVTAVQCDPDLGRARVLFASLDEEEEAGLAESRARLQASVSRQVRLKRTPLLSFAPDPAVATGQRIEEILRDMGPIGDSSDGGLVGDLPEAGAVADGPEVGAVGHALDEPEPDRP